jgi:hypothetical protein
MGRRTKNAAERVTLRRLRSAIFLPVVFLLVLLILLVLVILLVVLLIVLLILLAVFLLVVLRHEAHPLSHS